jgi:hypothetical protein
LQAAVHIPLLSAAPKLLNYTGPSTNRIIVTNVNEVLEVLYKTHLKLFLKGHTHISEKVVPSAATGGRVSEWASTRAMDSCSLPTAKRPGAITPAGFKLPQLKSRPYERTFASF